MAGHVHVETSISRRCGSPMPLTSGGAATGWVVRLGHQARWLAVACAVALMPFAADLASQAHVRAIDRHHPSSAIASPVAAPVPPRA